MITEAILNKFRNNLLNEDIPIPHGTKRAKIVCHIDLDGLISGITMVQQLQKQGIPKERIKVEFAQYGDENKEHHKHTEKFIGRKGEFVGVTDFAKLPKAKPFEIFQKLVDFNGDKQKFITYMKSKDFSKMSLEAFKKDFLSKFQIKQTTWTAGNLRDLHEALAAYYKLDDKPELTLDNIENLKYQIVKPDFVSDHHSNEQGSLSAGKTGEIAVDSPSEAEFLAKKYAPGMWPADDIKAVSMIDSASYTVEQLQNTIFLEKHFTGPDKKKNLATIVSCVYDNMAKKDREAAKWVIKNAQPSLVSAYTTALKAAGYSGKRLEYVEALKKGNVEKAKELLKEIPDILNKGYDRHDEPRSRIMNREDWAKKNTRDFKDAQTGRLSDEEKAEYDNIKLTGLSKEEKAAAKARKVELESKKGKMYVKNNFTIFDGTSTRTQYSRFATSLYSVKGVRSPFTMRYWGGFFQIAKNTLYKGTVNFAKVNDHVLDDIEKYLKDNGLNDIKIKNIMENMKEQNGGHSDGIWSFQGFDKIKPSSSEMGNYYMANRIARKNPDAPTASRIKKEKESGVIAKYNKIRKGAMDLAMDRAIYWTNELCPVDKSKTAALKNTDGRFEGK